MKTVRGTLGILSEKLENHLFFMNEIPQLGNENIKFIKIKWEPTTIADF